MIKVSALLLFVNLLAMQSFAQMVGYSPEMKNAVIEKFLKEANDSKSDIGKQIAQINKETEDGRNQNGTIALPIKRKDLQVTVISAEEIFAVWHYGYEDAGYCKASGNSATFMILLKTELGVHAAAEYGTVAFVGGAKELFKTRILTKEPIENICMYMTYMDLNEEADNYFGDMETEIKTTKFKKFELPEIEFEQ